jgi:predicted kinase
LDNSVTVIALRGLPLSGKTTLGKILSRNLGWHFIDIDYCRRLGTGDPERNIDINPWAASEERKKKETEDMLIAYYLMHEAVRMNISFDRSIICAATYSRVSNQKILLDIVNAHPKTRLKAVFCVFNGTEEEISRRINLPNRDNESGCKTIEHYLYNKSIYDYTDLWDSLRVDTSNPPQTCVEQIMEFIKQ